MAAEISSLDGKFAAEQIDRLELISGFPAKPERRLDLKRIVATYCRGERMDDRGAWCDANTQLRLLIDRALTVLRAWQSPAQLRDVYDSLFPPQPRAAELMPTKPPR